MASIMEDVRKKDTSIVSIVGKILESCSPKKGSKVIVMDTNDTVHGVTTQGTFLGACSNNKSGFSRVKFQNGTTVDVPSYNVFSL